MKGLLETVPAHDSLSLGGEGTYVPIDGGRCLLVVL